MSKKRGPGRPRKVGRPRLKKNFHKKYGKPKKLGQPRCKNKTNNLLDLSVLYTTPKKHKPKKRKSKRRESSSYDASCYGTLSCDGKPDEYMNSFDLS